jgi:hypothetical protein
MRKHKNIFLVTAYAVGLMSALLKLEYYKYYNTGFIMSLLLGAVFAYFAITDKKKTETNP